jgi:glycosyltransferase involved in cell wall biosynthesis
MQSSPRISVVVPALNEEAHIEQCLTCLCRQTLAPDLFEVILVDNGSTDRTVARAEQFADRLPLRILTLPRCTISELRNRGSSQAAGPILAFLDADCMAEPEWLEKALTLAKDDMLWGAHYLVQRDATWVGRIWFQHQATEQTGEVPFLPAGCLFVTRAAFDALGGFNPAVQTSEDVDLCSRAWRKGMKVMAYPSLAVYHEGTPRTLGRFYRQNRWHGKHVLRVFLAELPSTRNLPLILLTVYTFVAFWAIPLVFVLAFPRHIALAAIPLGLLLLPPLLLAVVKAIRSRSPADIAGLFVLYLTYLLARAAALAQIPNRRRR